MAFGEALRRVKIMQDIEEKWAIQLYLSGLTDRLATDVLRNNPKTCLEAMKRALQAVLLFGTNKKRSRDSVEFNNGNCKNFDYKRTKNFAKNKSYSSNSQKNKKKKNRIFSKNNQCFNCHIIGHFAKDCRSRKVSFP